MKTMLIRRLMMVLIIQCFVLSACAEMTHVTVREGQLEGAVTDGIVSFKGIPYAQPPVGDLRWKRPEPPTPWDGVREAKDFGPAPEQNWALAMMMTGGVPKLSEDCLYLNVWTPAKNPDAKLAVMVWIYGGAFINGAGSFPMYDLAKLAKKGVVTVSFNYRLGPFGFLAHPDLYKEDEEACGCYGLLDQVAALRWVRENIAQFGGDPSNVTIFGESAGGISVSMLTVVPQAKGLFQRAISQSGGSMAPAKTDDEAGLTVPSMKKAEQFGKAFLSKLGASDLKAARVLSADVIQKAADAAGMGNFWPVANGKTLPADEWELYHDGQFHETPVLIGTNSDEGALFVHKRAAPEAFEQFVRERYGPIADDMLKAYPHASDNEVFKSSKDLFRDSVFGWPTWAWAELASWKGNDHVWVYYFDYNDAKDADGASHAAEIPFVLGHIKGDGEKGKLSDMMSTYWVNFARTGNPNGEDLPRWPAYDATDKKTMFFDRAPSARPLANQEKLKAFDSYFEWRRWERRTTGTEEKNSN